MCHEMKWHVVTQWKLRLPYVGVTPRASYHNILERFIDYKQIERIRISLQTKPIDMPIVCFRSVVMRPSSGHIRCLGTSPYFTHL